MTHEQWEQVKDIFDAALRQKPDQRAGFLGKVCGADETVRREVEALLSSFDQAGGFMASPVVAKRLLIKGEYLGHYEISEKLGAGGTGEVYLARDTRLNRLVALKVLSSRLSGQSANRD